MTITVDHDMCNVSFRILFKFIHILSLSLHFTVSESAAVGCDQTQGKYYIVIQRSQVDRQTVKFSKSQTNTRGFLNFFPLIQSIFAISTVQGRQPHCGFCDQTINHVITFTSSCFIFLLYYFMFMLSVIFLNNYTKKVKHCYIIL